MRARRRRSRAGRARPPRADDAGRVTAGIPVGSPDALGSAASMGAVRPIEPANPLFVPFLVFASHPPGPVLFAVISKRCDDGTLQCIALREFVVCERRGKPGAQRVKTRKKRREKGTEGCMAEASGTEFGRHIRNSKGGRGLREERGGMHRTKAVVSVRGGWTQKRRKRKRGGGGYL